MDWPICGEPQVRRSLQPQINKGETDVQFRLVGSGTAAIRDDSEQKHRQTKIICSFMKIDVHLRNFQQ